MIRILNSVSGKGRISSRLAWFSVMAVALFLLPATAHADSHTYDLSGTFSNGVTINSGSSFTLANGALDGATLVTSAGNFSCAPNAPTGATCTFYTLSNGTDEFNINNGTDYISIQFLATNIAGFPPSFSLAGSTFEKDNALGVYSFLTSGTASLVTPEPGTVILMLSGFAALAFLSLRKVQTQS